MHHLSYDSHDTVLVGTTITAIVTDKKKYPAHKRKKQGKAEKSDNNNQKLVIL
ncbi:MAG: hypothetical protein QCH99_06955 [Candidatus Bathyarchaeota archaeon]|nr:hypothetical protein [Candidatus Bathyarchaeum tardum]